MKIYIEDNFLSMCFSIAIILIVLIYYLLHLYELSKIHKDYRRFYRWSEFKKFGIIMLILFCGLITLKSYMNIKKYETHRDKTPLSK